MKQPTTEQSEAIKRVAARPEGQLVLEYLKEAKNEVQQRLILDDDAHRVRSHQGEARALDMLLSVWKT